MMGNYHVRCGAGEKPEVLAPEAYLSLFGQIPQLEKFIAAIRSRKISASIILQSKSQLKAIYKDYTDTIDLYNTSDTRGTPQSYGLNYQKTGKDMQYLFVKGWLSNIKINGTGT